MIKAAALIENILLKAKAPGLNRPQAIALHVRAGQCSWGPVLCLLVSRTTLAFLVQACLALIFFLHGNAAPWQATIPYWSVYGTVIDLGCLLLMAHFLRREGLRLRDLVGTSPVSLLSDVLLGLGLFMLLFPTFIMGGTILSNLLVYEKLQPVIGSGLLTLRQLPGWAAAYSLLVWWVIWSPTEELTYNGYVLPRLEQITGRPWLALVLVSFWLAFQHCLFPLMLDWKYVLWRFLVFLPVSIIFPLLYRRLRRLRPLIFTQWPMDFLAALLTLAR
jgi:membrane protease YdiL (CAAX protease family)